MTKAGFAARLFVLTVESLLKRCQPHYVITGLVPVIAMGDTQRFSETRWPGQARP
jgi:hypothetical protein